MRPFIIAAALAVLAPAMAHAGQIQITAVGAARAPADMVLPTGGPTVEDALKIDATGIAMRNARAQALRIAEAGGATLGEIEDVTVLPNQPQAAISFSNADAPDQPGFFVRTGAYSSYDNALGVPSLTVRVALRVVFSLGS